MNAFVFNPGQRLASIWGGFKSVCTCSHTGDGTGSEHRDLIEAGDGHGQCKHADCKCTQFSWKRWTVSFGRALASVTHTRREGVSRGH